MDGVKKQSFGLKQLQEVFKAFIQLSEVLHWVKTCAIKSSKKINPFIFL